MPDAPNDDEINRDLAEAEDFSDAMFLIAEKYGENVTNNYERWQDGEYLRHMGDFIMDVKAAVAKFKEEL